MAKRNREKCTHAVIYLRVSTDKQRRSGLGREAQEATCRAFCARQGLVVDSLHVDDGLSGKLPLARRPGLASAVEAVRRVGPGVALVVPSVSRLGRTQRELWTLVDDRGAYALPLVSATEPFDVSTPMGRAFLGMLATFATLEADLASERTIDALEAARARGTKLGALSMMERVFDGRRDYDWERVATIRAIQERYAAGGYTHRSLADALNADGTPTAKGARWHAKTVRTALGLRLPDVGGCGA